MPPSVLVAVSLILLVVVETLSLVPLRPFVEQEQVSASESLHLEPKKHYGYRIVAA